MPFAIACPACRRSAVVHEAQCGYVVPCPHCHRPMSVPPAVMPAAVMPAAAEPNPFELSPERRRTKRGRGISAGMMALLLIGAFGAVVAGGVVVVNRMNREGPEPAKAPPPAAGDKPARLAPIASTTPTVRERPTAAVKRKAPAVDNAEWERKSRAKLKAGLDLLSARMTEDAKLAIGYAIADRPAKLTTEQLELMLEVYERLLVIAVVEQDRGAAEQFTKLVLFTRRDLGWDVDHYDEWAKPMLADTCARMGIKKRPAP